MTKFSPGDVVIVGEDTEAVIVYEYDPMPCLKCGKPNCFEWANVLGLDNGWLMHVSECDMKLSSFGEKLRRYDGKKKRWAKN